MLYYLTSLHSHRISYFTIYKICINFTCLGHFEVTNLTCPRFQHFYISIAMIYTQNISIRIIIVVLMIAVDCGSNIIGGVSASLRLRVPRDFPPKQSFVIIFLRISNGVRVIVFEELPLYVKANFLKLVDDNYSSEGKR